jgi:hypothetical protein
MGTGLKLDGNTLRTWWEHNKEPSTNPTNHDITKLNLVYLNV